MSDYNNIEFYKDSEVHDALKQYVRHPMIMALLQFTFPDMPFDKIEEKVLSCKSIFDFQTNIIYYSVEKVLQKSSEGLTYSGFDSLDSEEAYLFISNHRDIILDTSLLNYVLYENNLTMTASAIGDNLVKKPFLLALSRLNRNFLVRRGVSPREMLKSSQDLSNYIRELLLLEKRSVWMAQREGRTKDGNDRTQQGVLKMLAMARQEESVADFFAKLKIVPVSISYEFDPTDVLKMPELLAKQMKQIYVKSANEDFASILKGALGQKGRIHIQAGKPIAKADMLRLDDEGVSVNDQLQRLASLLDERIQGNYRLWPSNYVACDLLNASDTYSAYYTQQEKRRFERRIQRRVDTSNAMAVKSFLLMYAQPVLNQEVHHEK